jgi:ankyrin repeat protein
MEIDETNNSVIQASKDGNICYLNSVSKESVRKAECNVGCTALHWAAGSNQLSVLKYLLTSIEHEIAIFPNVNLKVAENKLAAGRTPLHYACRNGHLEVAKYLIQVRSAHVHVKDHKGVTPFQLAIWQNHLNMCRFLVEECNVVASLDVNSFGCGPLHWLGIVPFHRANDNASTSHSDEDGNALLPLAEWLTSQPNINVFTKQNTGHTALHKAAWGGHLALVKYLHEQFHMYDDCIDDTGNYAADLADMANTVRHSRIALYLRRECSMERLESLKTLGLSSCMDYSEEDIRKAYLKMARLHHPDARQINENKQRLHDMKFHEIQRAFEHLAIHGGISNKQRNPAHSIPLLLQAQDDIQSALKDSKHKNDKLFKARLLAVLLEYGDKGMNLSNIPKKWDQVWPDVSFDSMFTDESNSFVSGKKRRSGELLRLIQSRAGDVIQVTRMPLSKSVATVSKTQQKKGVIMIVPRNISREDILSISRCDPVEIDQ